MPSDADILNDVYAALAYEPMLSIDAISVEVRDGAVTLGGLVPGYGDRSRAGRAVERIKGVTAVANSIEVKLPSHSVRTDPEIARAVLEVLKWHTSVPGDRIGVRVEKQWVTLQGEVDWYFQREAAEDAIRNLAGVRGLSNLITVRPRAVAVDVRRNIECAFRRDARLDADHIQVDVCGTMAILSGTVRSYAEKCDAERAAHKAGGVTKVANRLIVANPASSSA